MLIPPYVSSDACRKLISPAKALSLAETALEWEASGDVTYPEPRALRMKAAPNASQHLAFHSKAVALPSLGVAGCRIVGYPVLQNGTRPNSEQSTRLIVLIDMVTGEPLAIVDEHYNYSLRTAASIGVAAQSLAGPEPQLGIIGAGVVAGAVARIMTEAVPLKAVKVFSRTRARSEALVSEMRTESEVDISISASLDDLLAGSNVVVTATTTKAPIFDVEQLAPGMLLCALGSNELTGPAYLGCDRLVVDDWHQTKAASDISSLIADGYPIDSKSRTSLPDIVHGSAPGREHEDQIIIVRTEGLASQDIIFAHYAWQESTRRAAQ